MRPTTLASQHFPSGPFRAPSGTKLTLHACWSVRTGTKLARHTRRPPQPVQNSPGTHAVHPNRDKTRPAHTPVHTNRYKTRHTPQKSPISRHFRHAGRKMSRFLRRHSQQGDFFLAVGLSNRSWATCVAPPAAVSLTERFIFIATTCLGHGKLALALTRRSCPPCRMAIGML